MVQNDAPSNDIGISPPPPPTDPPPSAPSMSAPPLAVVLDMAREQGDALVASPDEGVFGASWATLSDMPPRGGKVTVTGLMSNYGLNGKQGVVAGYRSDGAVLVDVDNIEGAPIRTENLMWGETFLEQDIPAPNFLKPKMNTTLFEGNRIIRVRPPKHVKSDASCCPGTHGWSDVSYYRQICWIYTSLLCTILSLVLVFICCFAWIILWSRALILLRWMAARHLDILLSASPPRRGMVVTHPTASIKRGGCCAHFCNGYTWRCLVYLVPCSYFFSAISVLVGSLFIPVMFFPCIRPLYAFACNVTSATLWLERSVAVCLLGHVVGEYDVVCELLDDTNDVSGSPRAREVNDTQIVRSYGAVARSGIEPELQQDGIAPAESSTRSWLVQRQRTMEEKLAVEKFFSSFLKLFGRQPRLQDINIQPPREAGRGPRHFVTLADSVSDQERLKLIKCYKQMFTTMYVHIVDIEEQQRQEGTDYSEMYS